MTLRERAEQAARVVLHDEPCPVQDCDNRDKHGQRIYCSHCIDLHQSIASAIQRVARDFAEKALRDAMADWSLHRHDNCSGPDVDKYVAAAIAEAEKG